jgi:hypothetical protein
MCEKFDDIVLFGRQVPVAVATAKPGPQRLQGLGLNVYVNMRSGLEKKNTRL